MCVCGRRTDSHGGGLRSALRPGHGPRPLLGSRRGAASRRARARVEDTRDTAVETNALSRPGRALARRADGDVPFYGARTRDCLPSQLGRTTGRPGAPVEPPISRRRCGRARALVASAVAAAA